MSSVLLLSFLGYNACLLCYYCCHFLVIMRVFCATAVIFVDFQLYISYFSFCLLFLYFFGSFKEPIVCWLALGSALLFIAAGIAWPNHLAAFYSICNVYLCRVVIVFSIHTTLDLKVPFSNRIYTATFFIFAPIVIQLVSLGGVGTDTGWAGHILDSRKDEFKREENTL